MEGKIRMTMRGQRRAKIMEMVEQKKVSLKEAAKILKLSYRQALRIRDKYSHNGDAAMNHGLIGQTGNNRKPDEFRERVIGIYKERFWDFGPTFASEKFGEMYEIQINPETLRRWLKEAGVWKRKRKRAAHRRKRERKHCFGEMIQIDGSIHKWYEDEREVCLMEFIDDATGKTLCLFDKGETTDVALRVLYEWITKYGIPCSIYADQKSVFYTDREPTIAEQLAGKKALTRFGKACDKLGIQIDYAYSAQAKGRVERVHGIQQDRLVKEMRLRGIKDNQSANCFLKETYWEKHNDRFQKEPVDSNDLHVRLRPDQNLNDYICIQDQRTVDNNFVIRYDNRFFQLRKECAEWVHPGSKVEVRKWLDRSIHIYAQDRELKFYEIDKNGKRVAA